MDPALCQAMLRGFMGTPTETMCLLTHEMAWQEECGQDQMVGLLRAVWPAVVVREGFLEVIWSKEPGLKRSRSGDSCEHKHRNGMGYEDPACIEVRS